MFCSEVTENPTALGHSRERSADVIVVGV
jgi:hypothetical protein